MEQIAFELTGSALKAAGMKQALDHSDRVTSEWTERTIAALEIFCRVQKSLGRETFLMEEFRASREHMPPASPNAWGAFTSIAAKRGLIKWTGQYQNAKSDKTHAHPVKLWEIM